MHIRDMEFDAHKRGMKPFALQFVRMADVIDGKKSANLRSDVD